MSSVNVRGTNSMVRFSSLLAYIRKTTELAFPYKHHGAEDNGMHNIGEC